jgi:hypothetical protein
VALPENPSKRFELVEKPVKPRPVTGTRRWQRYPLDVPIRVIVDTPGKTKLFDGRGNELSEGGMAVTAGAELSLGREVAIEFTPPYTCVPIRVRGTVRNRSGYRYGVEFLTESVAECEQVNRLRQMLQTLSTVSP